MFVTFSFDSKSHAYGFDETSTEYLKDYLSLRKLKIKINKAFSNWTNILHRAPQGSILSPLIFTVFLYDLFLFKPDIDLESYADDNTPFAMGDSSELEQLMKLRVSRKPYFLGANKVITGIFVMRSFQVCAVKSFLGLKLLISLLLKST